MKHTTTIAHLLAVGALAFSMSATAGMAGTKHDLSSTGSGNKFSGTGEICVFCHTPHGADSTASAPLWNRTLTGSTYTTYDSLGTSSLDGATAPVGSVSIACLSCHDGSQAMDSVLNEPGSGATVTSYNTGTWTGNDKPVGAALIGTDLSNDHPIGIQYGGGGLTSTTPNGTLKDPDFKVALNATINGNTIWWVDTDSSGTRDKADMQLYTRILSGVIQPFVECASCHDPHNNTNGTFLRISNSGSGVCLACHTK